uniref:Uncharacterized protein n=1 Tax=Arundo donax TaxID=35708 RepID=A0A0A9HLH5_ARUDO
MQQLRRRLLLP